jgi:large subunit ribosomal protein L15
MKLNDVNKGVHKNRKRLRVGRGPGSGRGRTAGRGNKGQGQLAGWSAPAIFEGGGTPLIRRIPKRGFHNRHGRIVTDVNVEDLEARFPAGSDVSPETLRKSGLAKGIWHEVKILGNGAIAKPLKVSAEKAGRRVGWWIGMRHVGAVRRTVGVRTFPPPPEVEEPDPCSKSCASSSPFPSCGRRSC